MERKASEEPRHEYQLEAADRRITRPAGPARKCVHLRASIDPDTHERQRDKINEQIVLAERQDTNLERHDLGAVLVFAEHVILKAARLWTEFSHDQKQRMQNVLFPKGVSFADEKLESRYPARCSSC